MIEKEDLFMMTLLTVAAIFLILGFLITLVIGVMALMPVMWVIIGGILIDRLILRKIIKHYKERRDEDYL